MEREYKHSIRVVARRTGLSTHVIRAWEKRYRAVSPVRTSSNRRCYSDADIERLKLLRRAIDAGRSIGQIAHLPTESLFVLVNEDEAVEAVQLDEASPGGSESLLPFSLHACLAAVKQLDAEGLEGTLAQAAVTLSRRVWIEQLIIPLMQKIGELWHDGDLRVAHEHLASAVVRTLLGSIEGRAEKSAPCLIATTPVGQMHELGALVAAATAASEGWRVTYLGPNLPAEEIAGAAQQNQAMVVALSIVYPPDAPYLGQELKKLRRYLSEGVVLLVGGRAVEAYRDLLDAIGAIILRDMQSLRTQLESLRSGLPFR